VEEITERLAEGLCALEINSAALPWRCSLG